MGALLGNAFKIVIQIVAGLGLGHVFDTFVAPKVGPEYYPEPVSPGWKPLKIAWFIGIFVIAFMLLKFIGKKMKISILK